MLEGAPQSTYCPRPAWDQMVESSPGELGSACAGADELGTAVERTIVVRWVVHGRVHRQGLHGRVELLREELADVILVDAVMRSDLDEDSDSVLGPIGEADELRSADDRLGLDLLEEDLIGLAVERVDDVAVDRVDLLQVDVVGAVGGHDHERVEIGIEDLRTMHVCHGFRYLFLPGWG